MDSFKESDHPRDGDGKFSESGSSGQSKAESQQKNNAREQQEVKVSATGRISLKRDLARITLMLIGTEIMLIKISIRT